MKIAIITEHSSWIFDQGYLKELEKRLPIHGIFPKIFLIKNNGVYGKIGISSYLSSIISLIKLLPILSKFDIIHTQFSFPLGFGCSLLKFFKLLRKPLIIHTHGVDVFNVPSINYGFRRLTLGKLFIDFAWKYANIIITTCKKAKFEISNNGINDDKIKVLYNGVDEKLFEKSDSLPSDVLELRNNADLFLLNVSSIVPVKNHNTMLRIFEKISEKYKSKYKIKIALIGKDYSKFLKKFNNQNILFLGKKEHNLLKNYYNIADLFFLPSLSEAHPWSMLEAMACELPVIASDVGGISETIDDPRFLIDPFNDDDILHKIEKIIEMDKEELKQVGIMNRKKILEKFTLDNHVIRLKQIYEQIC